MGFRVSIPYMYTMQNDQFEMISIMTKEFTEAGE
jgi:hypothetical protein